MGGFFGAVCKRDAVADVFFGTDYHSHLGTHRGGMAAYDPEIGLQRDIHNIKNSPFRTKLEHVLTDMKGNSAIGCISDTDPQPLLIRSVHGCYAISTIGIINNTDELVDRYQTYSRGHFDAMTGGKVNANELVAAMIDQKDTFEAGIRFAQEQIVGTCSILILRDNGNIIAARDLLGRLPVILGKNDDGYYVSFESYAMEKMDCKVVHELGPGEIVEMTADGYTVLQEPGEKMRICSFLWSYYGYPTATYEGSNVEVMRNRNGAIMADHDKEDGVAQDLDYVCGIPDSGTPHAIGYANQSHVPFGRPFIKYTPTWSRSFMPSVQSERNRVAKMKQVAIPEMIKDKKLLFVDDSIVRGTQLRETVEFLYANGAKEVHMRSACPPLMYGCKYLNFSASKSEMELLTRRIVMELEGEEGLNHLDEYSDGKTERGKAMRRTICEKFGFDSLEFQTLDGVTESIGIDPCKLCTYCWSGKE